MNGELIDTNKQYSISCLKTILAIFATSFVGTPFNPLLSGLLQFTNAYRYRNDIRDINVHSETIKAFTNYFNP